MSALSLHLPESLHRQLAEVASQDSGSINQWISSAVAEKMSALLTERYLMEWAARGSRVKFQNALAKVRDVRPEPEDSLGDPMSSANRRSKKTKFKT